MQAVQTTAAQLEGARSSTEAVVRWWGGVCAKGREGPWLVVAPGQPQKQISQRETTSLFVIVMQK